MQNSALSKQSAAVNTICLILTIEVDGELGKVKGIKSYLQCVEVARPEVIQYTPYMTDSTFSSGQRPAIPQGV